MREELERDRPMGGKWQKVADRTRLPAFLRRLAAVGLIASVFGLIAAFGSSIAAEAAADKPIVVATTLEQADSGGTFFADRVPGVNIEVWVNGVSTTTGKTTKTQAGSTTSPTFTDTFGTAKDTDTLIVCAEEPAGYSFVSHVVNSSPTADPDGTGRDCNLVPASTVAAGNSVVPLVFDYKADKPIVVATTLEQADNGGPFFADRVPGVNIEVWVNGVSTTTGKTTKTQPGSTTSPTFTDTFGTARDTDTLIVCAEEPAGYSFVSHVVNSSPTADPDGTGRDCNLVPASTVAATNSVVPLVFDYKENPPTAPLLFKEFVPDFIFTGAKTTVRYTIDNTANSTATRDITFIDEPPAGIGGTPSIGSTTCDRAMIEGWKFNISIAAGSSCTIEMTQQGDSQGTYNTTTTDVSSPKGDSAPAKATLTVSKPVCNGKLVTVALSLGQVPTGGADVILGTPGPDVISGLGGDDLICGLGGDDVINGGNGLDTIFGGDGDDIVGGQGGADKLFGGDGDDEIAGGIGNDIIRGGDGEDVLRGQGNDDQIFGEGDVDTIFGGSGNDVIETGPGGNLGTAHVVTGNGNNDTITGSPDDDLLDGQQGLDIIFGEGGDDTLTGGLGFDRLNGGDGNDTLEGFGSRDILHGDADDDFVNGGAGDDDLYGDAGANDVCNGGPDTDATPDASCETITGVP